MLTAEVLAAFRAFTDHALIAMKERRGEENAIVSVVLGLVDVGMK